VTIGEVALLALGASLVAGGLFLIGARSRSRAGFSRYESDAFSRSSVLNRERVDRINASRETAGGQWVDRARIVFFGVWLIALGAVMIANALG
jgi:hypothetical protein